SASLLLAWRSIMTPSHNAAVNPERTFSRAIGLNGLLCSSSSVVRFQSFRQEVGCYSKLYLPGCIDSLGKHSLYPASYLWTKFPPCYFGSICIALNCGTKVVYIFVGNLLRFEQCTERLEITSRHGV